MDDLIELSGVSAYTKLVNGKLVHVSSYVRSDWRQQSKPTLARRLGRGSVFQYGPTKYLVTAKPKHASGFVNGKYKDMGITVNTDELRDGKPTGVRKTLVLDPEGEVFLEPDLITTKTAFIDLLNSNKRAEELRKERRRPARRVQSWDTSPYNPAYQARRAS